MSHSLTLSLWALGRLPSELLPEVATDFLVSGLDTPSLRVLAGLGAPVMSEAGPLFERALSEMNIAVPPKDQALICLTRYYAQQIVEGRVTPYDGARKIWCNVINELDKASPLLLTFVGAASELEDLPERTLEDGYDRSEYALELENTIISAAHEVMNKSADDLIIAIQPICLETNQVSSETGTCHCPLHSSES